MNPLMLSYALSGAAGLRAPLTLLVLSIAAHTGHLHLAPTLDWLGSWWVIGLSAAVTLLDFLGDKIPGIDHALHVVHTGLAPVVGAVAAVSGTTDHTTPEALTAILGAGNALLVHSARSGTRVATTGLTGGLGNTAVSFLEDLLAGLFIVLAFAVPVLAAVLLVVLTVLGVRLAWRLASGRRRAA